MIIREANKWEAESWSYVIDVNKQSGTAINWLLLFYRLANEQFKKIKEEMVAKNGPRMPFAASNYVINFVEEVDATDPRVIWCRNKKNGTKDHYSISREGGYKLKGNVFLNGVISVAKMKSAAVTMRDKKENKLYKDFESVFLKNTIASE